MAMDYREKEHAFITIEKDLKGGKVPRVVLLCGSEEYLIEWYAQTLIRRYVSDACRALDLVRLEGDSLTLERIREGLETVSLMSERKVVFLPDFLPAAGKAVRGFPESDCKALAEYLPQVMEGSMLLMCVPDQEEQKPKKNVMRKGLRFSAFEGQAASRFYRKETESQRQELPAVGGLGDHFKQRLRQQGDQLQPLQSGQ